MKVGDEDIRWKYELGVKRLNEIGLKAVPAPDSLNGSEYLSKNPNSYRRFYVVI